MKSGWNPAPSSSSDPTRPPAATRPVVGLMIPAISRSSVDLPEPLRPTSPTASPGAIPSETSRAPTPPARPSARARRGAPSACACRARGRRTAARRPRPRSRPVSRAPHAVDGARARADDAGEHVDERRVGVRHLDPRETRGRARAPAARPRRRGPSGSRGGRRRTRPGRRARRRRPAPRGRRGGRGCPARATARPSATRSGRRTTTGRRCRGVGDEPRGLEQRVAVRVARRRGSARAASAP